VRRVRQYDTTWDGLIDRARTATAQGMCKKMGRFGMLSFFEEKTVDNNFRKSLNYNDLEHKRP
jgi:hypothetical protein